jgi:hypothetical protein
MRKGRRSVAKKLEGAVIELEINEYDLPKLVNWRWARCKVKHANTKFVQDG